MQFGPDKQGSIDKREEEVEEKKRRGFFSNPPLGLSLPVFIQSCGLRVIVIILH